MLTFTALVVCSFLLFLVDISQTQDIKFACDGAGKITTIEKTGITDTQIAIKMPNGSYCHYSEQNCKDAIKETKLHVMIQSDTQKNLLAGRQVEHYDIECETKYDVIGNANLFQVSVPSTAQPSLVTATMTPPLLSLKLLRKNSTELNGNVYIGEELTLQMSSTAYYVFPKRCTAINGDNDKDTVDIWTYNDASNSTCSTFDPAITIMKWKWHANKTTSISIYAFRFTSSPNVIIQCSAHLCPSTQGNCSSSCLDIARRRRRSSKILKKEQAITKTEEAHVSFRVAYQNIVRNTANALSLDFTLLSTAIVFLERFVRNY